MKHIDQLPLPCLGKHRFANIKSKRWIIGLLVSVCMCPSILFGEAVVLQELWKSKVRLWCTILNSWLNVCTMFNHACKLNRWWWNSLISASMHTNWISDGGIVWSVNPSLNNLLFSFIVIARLISGAMASFSHRKHSCTLVMFPTSRSIF